MKIGEKIGPVRLNMRVLADELNALGCDFSSRTVKDTFSFSSMCIYDDQNELSHDYVYYLPKDRAGSFPVDKYVYVSSVEIQGEAPHICLRDKTEIFSRFLNVMNWEVSDSYICIKTISQNTSLAVKSDNSLRSKYAELIKSFFCFYNGNECCLIVNLTRSELRREDIDSLLAPIIRESYMYAGISYVFHDLRNAYQAFKQTDFVLSEVPNSPDKWVNSFDRCVLDYMVTGVTQDLSMNMIITPDLLGE